VHLLLEDRGVGGAAADGEVVAAYHDRAAVDAPTAHHEVRRGQLGEPALLVVAAASGQRAHLVERSGIEDPLDALAHRELAE
jgi:hypothetical protein